MSVIELTQANFDEIIENNDIVVADFWADWCEPCRTFDPIYEQVASEHPEIVFGKINTEKEKQLSNDFNVRSIPMLMIFRQNIAVAAESGLLPASVLKDLIKQAQHLDMDEVRQKITQNTGEISQ